jgi:hypothetical protein
MMKKVLAIIFSLFLLAITGCTSAEPQMSPMQLREMTTKEVEADYKTAFRATMTVLQDQDYIINNTDFNSGLITCEKEVEKSNGASDVLMVLFVDARYSAAAKVNVSATINEVTKTTSKIRLSIQEKTIEKGTYSNSDKSKNVKDPEIYKSLFDQISVEIERLKAVK